MLVLQLSTECSLLPDVYRRWLIDNPAPYEVSVTWRIANSPYSGTLTIPANGSVSLNTPVANGPTILILIVDGVPIAVAASDPTRCPVPPQPPQPSPPPVPSPPPTGTGGNLPGLPNTGNGPVSAVPGDARLAGAVGTLAALGVAAAATIIWLRRRGKSA